jgi:PAS domain S-box-containing protein
MTSSRTPLPKPEFDPEKLLASALDVTRELMVIRRSSGNVSYVNHAFLETFGGKKEDWIGRWFSMAPPRSREDSRHYDMLMRTVDGAAWIEWDECLLPDDQGVVSVGRDVTARREAHESMAETQRAKSLFFAAVTHELRTPLSGAMGMSRLLKATELKPDQADYVRSIAASTEHALTMIDDILDLSQLEAGKLQLRPGEVDVAALVRETVELAAPRAHEKGLEVAVVYAAGCPSRITGDAARLKQILFNLIGNAVKFTQEGGIRIEVADNPGHADTPRLSLSVSDTGPGISETDQETLFEHFERGAAEREGAEGGAGLGLAMVRRLVESMGSSMGVESQLGRGSNFWVTLELPVIDICQQTPLRGRKLAVASENDVLRLALVDQLLALGGDVVGIDTASHITASSGRELLLDGDWREFAGESGAAHVWLMVTPGQKNDVIDALPEHVQNWMVKPIRRSTLVEQITGQIPALSTPRESLAPDEDQTEQVLLGLHILVAEDDPVNALIARKTLERLGAQVSVADSGPRAIQILETESFDAALLDQRMPGMDGKNVAELARLSGVDIPLIALTANTSEADRQRCLEAGMDEFLSKPVDPDILADTLLRLCGPKKQASIG